MSMQAAKYVHFSDRLTESLNNIGRVIQDNKKTLDSIQDMAVELTRAIRGLEGVAIRYVRLADQILDNVEPFLKTIPLAGPKVLGFVSEAHDLSDKIMNACELIEKVLPGVEAGLTTADMNKLQSSTGDVQRLTATLQGLVKPAGAKK